jgi:hypothetical protein
MYRRSLQRRSIPAAPRLARRPRRPRNHLLIHPLVLGPGRRLFPDGSPPAALRLVGSVTTTTGVVIATYQPAGALSRGR